MNKENDTFNEIINYYKEYFADFEKEFISAMKEGISEGTKEGVKAGILNGLIDCFDIGFLNIRKIKSKTLEEIIKDVAAETTEEQVNDNVRREVCPVIENRFEDICKTILNKIKEEDITIDSGLVELMKKLDVEKLAVDKKDEIMEFVKQNILQNFILAAAFDGLQNATCDCVIENTRTCAKKIQDAAKPAFQEV
ncbi:MAG: hypothetical protein OIN88_02580 [Candidatus Methanoperedens sp.]|nr:hypothetical protein [Candidatus Methanoperedens sp.]MCZ7360508.1 hypothetical protein [Candidatus Methanoperedens sp.]HLB70002.1 hypothetical protein [Candidatus Methanoperedens sp.]